MRSLIIILLAFNLVACESENEKQSDSQVVHVVLVWLKESGNKQHIKRIVDATQQLKEITEIKEFRVGRSISSDRKIVDDSFDVGLYMIFNSIEDMQRYLEHSQHKKAVKQVIKPLSEKIQVYDFNTID